MHIVVKANKIIITIAGLLLFVCVVYLAIVRATRSGDLLGGPTRTASNMVSTSAHPYDLGSVTKGSQRAISRNLPETALFDEYLTKYERDDNSLVTVYLLTRDENILSELSKKARSSVAFLVLALHSKDPAEKLSWASEWAESEPQNNAAKLLLASAVAETGNIDDARRELLKVDTQGAFYTPDASVKLQAAEAWQAAGWSSTDARRMVPHNTFELDVIRSYQRLAGTLWGTVSAGSDDERILAATDQIRIGDGVEALGRYSGNSEFGWGIKRRALEQLPPDTLLGDSDQTVEQTIRLFERQEQEQANEAKRFRPIWEKATPKQVAGYFDRAQISTAQEARAWLEREVVTGSSN